MGGKASNHIQQSLRSVKTVRTWQLFLILLPLLFLTATLLRFDHLKMVDLRAAVLRADEAGNDTEIEQTLQSLKEYVFTHTVINVAESNGMQTIIFGTGPFYLEQQYRRAANAAIAAAENTLVDDSNPNGNIYAAVASICQPQAIANGWQWSSSEYLNCWTSELAKYPSSDELSPTLISASIPSTELYRRDYASPLWTPTPAGFAMLACAIVAVWILVRIVIWLVLNIALFFLKHTKKS